MLLIVFNALLLHVPAVNEAILPVVELALHARLLAKLVKYWQQIALLALLRHL